jgi:hypothetical protein
MLVAGPYRPPKCKVGTVLKDLHFGEVVVIGKRGGWPVCAEPSRPGPNPLGEIPVLTGDLIRAVCEESIHAVADAWGVTDRVVRRWRSVITGKKTGVNTALALLRSDPEFRRRWY